MLAPEFRSAGAMFLNNDNLTEVYFTAQHFGMRTRLLDWSTNPLAALFFACHDEPNENGVVYAMDARKVLHKDAKGPRAALFNSVMSMHCISM